MIRYNSERIMGTVLYEISCVFKSNMTNISNATLSGHFYDNNLGKRFRTVLPEAF